ncbi:hypothetical protein GIB67_031981 [Kingdonia uniflora]|uniref:beta-galactosidase n=1 Tax=Kingdonia uniflora TaxID=39325 RepID=A0A7J7NTZ5_9MAGN|nr:hypothetical protein GIB67_031981 [Kingdonia uniflora]
MGSFRYGNQGAELLYKAAAKPESPRVAGTIGEEETHVQVTLSGHKSDTQGTPIGMPRGIRVTKIGMYGTPLGMPMSKQGRCRSRSMGTTRVLGTQLGWPLVPLRASHVLGTLSPSSNVRNQTQAQASPAGAANPCPTQLIPSFLPQPAGLSIREPVPLPATATKTTTSKPIKLGKDPPTAMVNIESPNFNTTSVTKARVIRDPIEKELQSFVKEGETNGGDIMLNGPFYEWVPAGLTSVKIAGMNNGTSDLSSNTWIYKIGLEGEHLKLYEKNGLNSVKWQSTSVPPKNQPLTWYKAVVDPPSGDEPIGLDMIDMGKGLAWLNGEPIGRYWPRTSSLHEECVQECNYRGKFSPNKCSTGCGEPTQRWYHVPRSWFKPSGNILVIFEEKGGDPSKIRFSRRRTKSVCALISEDHPSPKLEFLYKDTKGDSETKATLHLKCPENTVISAIQFASFGTPLGKCGSYSKGTCHDPNSAFVVEKVCLHKNGCKLPLSENNFKADLCPGSIKKLAVEATCK